MRLDTIHILAVALMLSLTAQQRLDAQTYVNTQLIIVVYGMSSWLSLA